MSETSEASVFASELPLVFAGGLPKSLDTLSLVNKSLFDQSAKRDESLSVGASAIHNVRAKVRRARMQVATRAEVRRAAQVVAGGPQLLQRCLRSSHQARGEQQNIMCCALVSVAAWYISFQHWSSFLRRALQRCYSHFNSSYLLEFSEKIAAYISNNPENTFFLTNGDGTVSLKKRSTNQVMFTILLENKVRSLLFAYLHSLYSRYCSCI